MDGAITLDSALKYAVGGRTAGMLHRAWSLETVGDLLSHYPRRYSRRGELTALADLHDGDLVTIVAEVRRAASKEMRARHGSLQEVILADDSGAQLEATFFNQPWRMHELTPGRRGTFSGKVTRFNGVMQLTHPDYELFDDETPADPDAARRWAEQPIPVYPATASIPSWKVQAAIAQALDTVDPTGIEDPLPDAIRERHRFLPYQAALERIHRPENDADWRRARATLTFHEAFLLQIALLQRRAAAKRAPGTARQSAPGGYLERLDAALPFELTADQRAVGAEIAADLARTTPMNRLVQGEVGSGKTLVAVRAMAAVADSGGQSALLAPTEVLAAQHLRSITAALGPDLAAELMPTLLTGSMPQAERKKVLLRIVSGQARIVVGTHALLSEQVEFFDLGLVVVDEQHRFGVEQRERLRTKGRTAPHTLVLTATPIPRTVAMTVFGDLDVSTIAELPAGRAGIESFTVPLVDRPGWWPRVWQRAAEEIAKGRQVYVVAAAIDAKSLEEGEDLEPVEDEFGEAGDPVPPPPLATVEATLQAVREAPALAGARVAALHGRLPSAEKDAVMRAFAAGEIDLLVATTVIEVGVDVPNASTMIVLDADRFGVAQLHQLRGRVGRGGVPGLALFVTRAEPGSPARERVDAVAATTDGFALARVDLELRREGDVLGSAQAGGRTSLKLLRVAHDADVIVEAREAAESIVADDPTLTDHPALRRALERRLDDTEREFITKS